MTRFITIAAIVACGLLAGGCFNIKAPEKFEVTAPEIRVGSAASDTPTRVPETHSLDECQSELRRAYVHIDELERDNRRLRSRVEKLESENEKLERELKDERKAAKKERDRLEDQVKRERKRHDDVP